MDRKESTITDTDAAAAYRKLRNLILRTELKPGVTLVESDLMKRLGVGRTPLRDALHTLAHEGLVEIIPRRGTFVSQVTLSDLQQIFDVRSGIEAIVAQLAVSRVEDSVLEPLQNLVERAKRTEGPESDVGLDSEFHNLLLEIANGRYLSEMYRPLADASVRLLYLTRCGMERPEEQVQVFQAALDALRGRSADELAAVLRNHVRVFRDRVNGSLFRELENVPVTKYGT